MTRKLTFILMALIALTGLRCWAQSDIFTEGFENGIPEDWINIDNVDNIYKSIWHETPDGSQNVHGGTKAVCSFKTRIGAIPEIDSYLITSQLGLGKHATMRFWMKPEEGEKFAVLVSTTGTELANFSTIKQWTSTSDGIVWNEYNEYTVDLSAYADKDVFIAFRHFNTYESLSEDAPSVYLDDITVFLGKTAPIAVDFESGAIPSGWTTIDNDNDECEWQITTENAHGGSYALVSPKTISSDYAVVDNFLVSPQLDLGRNAKLEFYAAPDFFEVFGVYVSTTGTNPSDFTKIQQWTSQNNRYDIYAADLGEYAGQKVYLAIRHNKTYNYWDPADPVSKVYIDDITIDLGDYEENCHNVFVTQPPYGHGQISANPTLYVKQGTQISLTATPEFGYALDQWTIEPEVEHDQYGFSMPDNDVNVTASFKALTMCEIRIYGYTPEIINPYATYQGEVITKAPEGTVVTLEYTMVDNSYELDHWAVNGYRIEGNTFIMTSPNALVEPVVKLRPRFAVTIDENIENGSITATPNANILGGTTVTLNITPAENYSLYTLTVTDDNGQQIAVDCKKFTMPESNVSVTATFMESVTVNEGTATSQKSPAYTYGLNLSAISQFIIPASQLASIEAGGRINRIMFHVNPGRDLPVTASYEKSYDGYITEVDQETMSDFISLDDEGATKFFEGHLITSNGNTELCFDFSTPFIYMGGNLAITFNQTTWGGYDYTKLDFLGIEKDQDHGAIAWYKDVSGSEKLEKLAFAPMTTLFYTQGDAPEYTINMHSNGVVTQSTFTYGQALPDCDNTPEGLSFCGWTTTDIETYTRNAPAYVTKASDFTDVYAVFKYVENVTELYGNIKEGYVAGYSDLSVGDQLVIANERKGKILCQRSNSSNNHFEKSNVSISWGEIDLIPSDAVIFTVSGESGNWKFNFNDKFDGQQTLSDDSEGNLAPANMCGTSACNTWSYIYDYNYTIYPDDRLNLIKDSQNGRYIAYDNNLERFNTVATIDKDTYQEAEFYLVHSREVSKTYYMTKVLTDGEVTDVNTNNIIIKDDRSLTVTGRLEMNANGLFRNEDAANFVFEDGAQFYYTGTEAINATFEKDITGYSGTRNNYYLIANPTDETGVTNLASNSYDLYTFNPAGDGEGNEWINIKSSPSVANGTGYLYANSATTTLEFAGNLTPAGSSNIELTYANAGEGIDFPGFNLIGNPYACDAYLNKPAYVLNGNGDDFESIEAGTPIAPSEGFFVEATPEDQSVTLSTTAPVTAPNALSLNVSQNRGNVIDRAIVNFDGANDLHKFMMNPAHTNLSIAKGGETFAVISAETEGELPVNFKAEKNGTYTITVNTKNVDAEYLHLIDNMTGMDVDLLATPSYTFEAKTSDYASRFKLVFSMNNDNEDMSQANSFAYINNGEIIISNEGRATLQVIDVLGRIVSSEEINGECRISTNGMTAGLYILNLNGMTQKIVVR